MSAWGAVAAGIFLIFMAIPMARSVQGLLDRQFRLDVYLGIAIAFGAVGLAFALRRLEEEGEGLPLALVDGAPTLPPGPSLWCGDARIAALLGLCCLPWGAFEIGVAAGRLLQRRLRHPEALFPKLRWLVHPRDSRGEPLPREGKRKP